MKNIMILLFTASIMIVASCSVSHKTEELTELDAPINKSSKSAKNNLITVALLVETSINELGSFNVSLEINPDSLEFLEFKTAAKVKLDIKYKYFKDKNLIKIIGTSIQRTGIFGNQKLAYLYFRNPKDIPIKKFSNSDIKLFKESAYTPYPKMIEIPAKFTISISEGMNSH